MSTTLLHFLFAVDKLSSVMSWRGIWSGGELVEAAWRNRKHC